MGGLVFPSQAFVSPSAHLTKTTSRVSATTMSAWQTGGDNEPRMIGLKQGEWPKCEDSTKTMGEFFLTLDGCSTDDKGIVTPATKPASIPVDSVPRMIGLKQGKWPKCEGDQDNG